MVCSLILGLFGLLASLQSINALPERADKKPKSSIDPSDVEILTETRLKTVYRTHAATEDLNGPQYITRTVSVSGTNCSIIQQAISTVTADRPIFTGPVQATTTAISTITAYVPASMASIISMLSTQSLTAVAPPVYTVPTSLKSDSPPGYPSTKPSQPASKDACAAADITVPASGEYKSQKGALYRIRCLEDNSAGPFDVYPVHQGGFKECFDACDRTASCLGFTYFGTDSGNCYLKSTRGTFTPSNNPQIMSAFKNVEDSANAGDMPKPYPTSVQTPKPYSSSIEAPMPYSSNAEAPKPYTSSVAAPKPYHTPSSGSCGALASPYTDDLGKVWSVKCDYDFAGNDLVSVSASNFHGCFPKCGSTPGCVAFSYRAETCYLKSKAWNGGELDGVDAAAMISPPEQGPKPYGPPGYSTTSAPMVPGGTASATFPCNPAHSYPGGATCISSADQLTLVTPSASTIATPPAYSPPAYSPPPYQTGTPNQGTNHCDAPTGSRQFVMMTQTTDFKSIWVDDVGNGMYLSIPSRDANTQAVILTPDPMHASPAVADTDSGLISMKNDGECRWSGLSSLQRNENDRIGRCSVLPGVGTGNLVKNDDGTISINNANNFDTWLACSEHGLWTLQYLRRDLFNPFSIADGYLKEASCSKVQLKAVPCPPGSACSN